MGERTESPWEDPALPGVGPCRDGAITDTYLFFAQVDRGDG